MGFAGLPTAGLLVCDMSFDGGPYVADRTAIVLSLGGELPSQHGTTYEYTGGFAG